MRLRSRDLFQTAHTEGGLLPADLLQRVADNDGDLEGLTPSEYHLAPGERLNEAITRSWNRLLGAWRAFDDARAQLAPGDRGGRLTRERWLHVLFDELGYGRLVQQPAIEVDDKAFPVFTQWQHTPIHLVGCGVTVDTRTPGVAGAAGQSPHSLLQELLNRSPERLWGVLSNGLVLRVLRDNVALTRQAYLEFDLEGMFTGEVYPDFVLLWLVAHQSRVEAERPGDCWLERWTREAAELGTRALDTLRDGVQEAIEILGTGFLAHPANHELHAALRDGALERQDYYRTLLRLVYRLLFLFVAEDRDVLLDPAADRLARERYRAHYSTQRLRSLAQRRRGGRQHDRYEQLRSSWTRCTARAARRSACRHWAASCGRPRRSASSARRRSPTSTCSTPCARWPASRSAACAGPSTSATSAPRSWARSTSRCSSSAPSCIANRRPSRSPRPPAASARPPAATTRRRASSPRCWTPRSSRCSTRP